MLEPIAPPQHAEYRFGDERAVVLPELAMRAKIALEHGVRRLGHRQHAPERIFRRGEQ